MLTKLDLMDKGTNALEVSLSLSLYVKLFWLHVLLWSFSIHADYISKSISKSYGFLPNKMSEILIALLPHLFFA